MTRFISTKEKKELDFFQHPPHRRYFCFLCKEEVIICLFCDRNHKYCLACKTKSKKLKNKRSNNQYRSTLKGKKTRAACESRRRERLKEKVENSDSCKIMGEPSTNISKVLPNNKNEAVVASEKTNIDLGKGESDVPVAKTQVNRNGSLGFSSERRGHKALLCAYCHKECSIFTYQNLLSKKVYKKKYREMRSSHNFEGVKL